MTVGRYPPRPSTIDGQLMGIHDQRTSWYLLGCVVLLVGGPQLGCAFIPGPPSCPSRFFSLGVSRDVKERETAATAMGPEVVASGGSFRSTMVGEVSIVSMNVLAPSYHALEHPLDKRDELAAIDRRTRYPMAIATAKRANGDILCLQEVEGGQTELIALLEGCLAEGEQGVKGYDSFEWSPLLPNREQDVVGLAVAWRSDRHRLVSCETFRRGMVIQLAELSTGATFALANLHLPAKPSAIEGRLRAMAAAIRRLQSCEAVSGKRLSALDGLAVVAGDFNCGHNAPAVKLLKTGYSLYGTLRDRNYKAKISKRVAGQMKHGFRFRDVYEGDMRAVAPVTVSLKGRGPGCMDHVLFTSKDCSKNRKKTSSVKSSLSASRRKARRERGQGRHATVSLRQQKEANAVVRLASVLATVDLRDERLLEAIEKGLPDENMGWYSDHFPVGALFASQAIEVAEEQRTETRHLGAGGRANMNRRRAAYEQSLLVRRRHNMILRYMAEWLLEHGATDLIRDVPLYKWKWISSESSSSRLSKKMRAPDLCCVVGNTLFIVEVTVTQKQTEIVHKEKVAKYQDVFDALGKSEKVRHSNISLSPSTCAVVLDEMGEICDRSRADLQNLVATCCEAQDVENALKLLSQTLSEIVRA